MTITIDATVGGAAANSFVTAAEATAYLANRLNASTYWTDGTLDDEHRALIEATRELSMRPWVGRRATTTQALSWPRQWVTDIDSPNQYYLSTTAIPQRVKDATCELALEFLKAGTTDVAALPSTDGIIEKTVDVLTTRWADPYQRKQGLARYPRVLTLIAPYLDSLAGTGQVRRG